MIKCTSLAIILQAYHIDLDIMQWLDVISNVEHTLFYTFTRFHIIALLITSRLLDTASLHNKSFFEQINIFFLIASLDRQFYYGFIKTFYKIMKNEIDCIKS